MADSQPQSAPTAAELAAKYSCVLCHKRKVKCDRAQPCSNCTKSSAACDYIPPPAPRRKRKKPSDDLIESSLKLEKAQDDASFEPDRDSSENVDEKRRRVTRSVESRPPLYSSHPRPAKSEEGSLLIDAGKAHYVENNLWMSLSDELPSTKPLLQEQLENSTEDEFEPSETNPNNILFAASLSGNVTALYPARAAVMALWRYFKENVDPLTRLVHIPTMQKMIELSCQNVAAISRNNIALLFSAHLIAVESISDEQCQASTGEPKAALSKRLLCATQHCFTKGGILRTSDLTMLTAFLLYILAIRMSTDAQTVSALMALAIRIAHRIGLHSDITNGLRPYDIEMRRRVWKQTLLQDWICAEVSGISPFHELYPIWWHAPNPRNVFDWEFDMNTSTEDFPESRKEPTDMFIVQMRYNFGRTFLESMKAFKYDVEGKQDFSTVIGSLAARDQKIDELERHLQDCYIRYADPIIPSHILVTIVARAAVVNMRIRAHHPRQYVDAGISLPLEEHEKLFNWSLQAIQYDNLFFTNPALERFRWHSRQLIQYHPIIYLLTCVRSKRINNWQHSVDEVWRELDILFANRPEVLERKHVLHLAIGLLAMRAWETHENEMRKHNRPSQPPKFIQHLHQISANQSSLKTSARTRIPSSNPRFMPAQYTHPNSALSATGHQQHLSPHPQQQQQQQQQQPQPQLLDQADIVSPWAWQSAQGYGMNIPIMTSGTDMPQANAELWTQWDQLCLNPDMPLDSNFGFNTFNALDGFFAPMKEQ